jgi:GH15 family glucan-1,4-alpha-glucosidase
MDARAAPVADVEEVPAIEDYGVVGNLETVALVANTGAVEFFCYPRFDSPTVFAAMLDRTVGGAFRCAPTFAATGAQRYLPDTNVLVTRFEAPGRVVEITDFMPFGCETHTNQLVRLVACLEGEAEVEAVCAPALAYARGETTARAENGHVAFEHAEASPLRLCSDRPLGIERSAAVVRARLAAGERMVLNLVCDAAKGDVATVEAAEAALATTVDAWNAWVGQSTYGGRWRDAVIRSALALKLMFSARHGSIVAAATFGLPETIGGVRNWDYRYCWIRDSAFTIYAMLRLGFTEEAAGYRDFIRDRLAENDHGELAIMYRVDGSTEDLEERTLSHLSGYHGSRPVRIGNGAARQTQHDIYGTLVDTLYLARRHLEPHPPEGWAALKKLIGHVCATWRTTGSGIWEMRGPPQHFIDGRLMAWVALDRAVRLADKSGREVPEEWLDEREAVARSIHEEFWNEEIGAFTQTAGGSTLDAVALLMPLMKFIPTTDVRFRSTLRAIEERLVVYPYVRRYEPPADGIEGLDHSHEGHFVTCSFWYAEVLARSSRVREATELFEALLTRASPLGLFSEELDDVGRHLGNTPQALSHLSLISAAVALDRAIANGGEPF